MTALSFFLVAAGGAPGALLRFFIALSWPANWRALPFPTLLVNILGSALLGALLSPALGTNTSVILFIGVGFCGAFTTFSTFTVEAVELAGSSLKKAAIYTILTTLGSIAAFALTYTFSFS